MQRSPSEIVQTNGMRIPGRRSRNWINMLGNSELSPRSRGGMIGIPIRSATDNPATISAAAVSSAIGGYGNVSPSWRSMKRCATTTAPMTAQPIDKPNVIAIVRILPADSGSVPGMNAIMLALSTMTAKIVATHWFQAEPDRHRAARVESHSGEPLAALALGRVAVEDVARDQAAGEKGNLHNAAVQSLLE